MKHPDDLLPDYAMDLLEGAELAQVEAHLQACSRCRAEVQALRDAYYALPLGLGGKAHVPRRVNRRGWGIALLAAAAAVLLVWLGLPLYRQVQTGLTVAALLAEPNARTLVLQDAEGRFVGRVTVGAKGEAVFVLAAPPPPGRVYQAWGHRGGTPVSLGVTRSRMLRVRAAGFEAVGVSLEPPGGSPRPTHPMARVAL